MITDRKYSRVMFKLLCLYLLVVTIVPGYISFSVGLFELSTDRMFLMILLLLIVVGLFSFRKFRGNLKINVRANKSIFLLVFSLLFFQLLSVFTSVNPTYSFKRYLNFALLSGVPFMAVFSLGRESLDFRFLGRVLTFAISTLVVICLVEWITEENVFSAFVDTDTLNEFQQQQLLEKVRGEARRIQGPFSHPLALGQFSVTIIPIFLYLRRFLRGKTMISLSIALLGMLMLLTRSRTVFIILLVSVCVYGYHYLRFHRHGIAVKAMVLITGLVVGVIGVSVIDPTLLQEFFGGRELTQDTNRLTQVVMAWPLILKNVWLGFGFGMGSQTLGFGTSQSEFGTIDNYFLTLVLDSGVIVLGIFMAICYQTIKLYFRLTGSAKFMFYGLLFFIINLFTLSIIDVHTFFYTFLAIILVNGSQFTQTGSNSIS